MIQRKTIIFTGIGYFQTFAKCILSTIMLGNATILSTPSSNAVYMIRATDCDKNFFNPCLDLKDSEVFRLQALSTEYVDGQTDTHEIGDKSFGCTCRKSTIKSRERAHQARLHPYPGYSLKLIQNLSSALPHQKTLPPTPKFSHIYKENTQISQIYQHCCKFSNVQQLK